MTLLPRLTAPVPLSGQEAFVVSIADLTPRGEHKKGDSVSALQARLDEVAELAMERYGCCVAIGHRRAQLAASTNQQESSPRARIPPNQSESRRVEKETHSTIQ